MATFADKILNTYNSGNELEAFDKAVDIAVTVREASEYDVYRFEDSSSVRVYISDDHEITMFEE